MEKFLHEIAKLVDGELSGDGATKVSGLSNIKLAQAGDLIFAVPLKLGIRVAACSTSLEKMHGVAEKILRAM